MQTPNTGHCLPVKEHSDNCFSEDAGDIYGGGGDSVQSKFVWSMHVIQQQ